MRAHSLRAVLEGAVQKEPGEDLFPERDQRHDPHHDQLPGRGLVPYTGPRLGTYYAIQRSVRILRTRTFTRPSRLRHSSLQRIQGLLLHKLLRTRTSSSQGKNAGLALKSYKLRRDRSLLPLGLRRSRMRGWIGKQNHDTNHHNPSQIH
ncbi:hypothetical protein GcC1_044033 [Golovinomyces cichoracearum]|uniref:Uncharacterized protein n=1 Tax=Golovinomyces cichoracearum TaxID=62708 RepID=A0A420IYR7_9PEZI|nr:hypothetical protein GcC1_044033 [Golovinomyces cichoracearum]